MHRKELAKIAYKIEFFLHNIRQIENSKIMENWPKTKIRQNTKIRQKMKTKMKN